MVFTITKNLVDGSTLLGVGPTVILFGNHFKILSLLWTILGIVLVLVGALVIGRKTPLK